ncbi:ABC transporter ATP-binding protein [Staphylococcus massiliensis]|uniref:Putative hemin import ATP-binding protein HrtA n=1 Tax=Staphylococcus massiliensis S46 TaxID=1229783 RepID=K9B2M6_9STAP|nr:ABC transporter ATP-binding protein [Staphylococcus massiliensis]EKU49057.1 ABC transporter ATP-binding protein [Staphylococcus massiliensis S46]MCG3402402.1 ABC transporter ATP-binding protein [Staphylococcus massiliensis]MCG3411634.1 ABC transporter ATP-binding protein [Staphylococcus massiliensis]
MSLVVQNLKKSFGTGEAKTDVLKGIDFTINEGELVVLNGASGSGKSTLLSILGGLMTPTSGDVLLDDKAYLSQSQGALTNMRLNSIGFIFQASHLLPYLKVIDQLVVVGQEAGMSKKEAQTRAKSLLTQIGMDHRMNVYPKSLSGGEKQRVAIMRAWMNHPYLILADEPTASLDASRAIEVVEMIKDQVKKQNSIGIMVTHDQRLFDYADRVIELSDGKILSE